MVRSYEELNKLEQRGLVSLLERQGWTYTNLSKSGDAMTKKMDNKGVTVPMKHFHVDED